MKQYLDIVQNILDNGVKKENRTGIDTYSVHGVKFEHDMSEGFPLLTTKRVPLRLITSENEFFIRGITDKKWLQDRNNHIWNEWCNPEKVPYGHDELAKQEMALERDLGPVYGFQWRHFGATYKGHDVDHTGEGVDQLANLVNCLKTNPGCRRMIVSSWNPKDQPQMALPPCHFQYQVLVRDDKLDLIWTQRSIDTMLGLPFNIAGYGLMLHLLAKETGLKEGKLIGNLADTHIYENHLGGARKQLTREPQKLPKIVTDNFSSIFDWEYTQTKVEGYKPQKRIKFEVAV